MSYGTLTARREKGYEMSAISISAIICTYNGGRYLKRAIESLASQSLSRKDYEIIVVDNCSTDSTKEIVGSLLNNVENLRYCYEPEIGLSHARNRGIQESMGEETELCLRLLKDGWKVIYNPAAVVHHIVPDSRIEQTWFLKRALDWGISRVVVDHSGIEGTFGLK